MSVVYDDGDAGIRKRCSRPTRSYKISAMRYSHWEPGVVTEPVPYMRLRGRWLEDLGFEVGSTVKVEAETGRLVITVSDPPVVMPRSVPRKLTRFFRERVAEYLSTTNPLPHPGTVLHRSFLVPMAMSVHSLAGALGVGREVVASLIEGQCGIGDELAVPLGRYFRTSPKLWILLQARFDLEQRRLSLAGGTSVASQS